MAYGMMGQGLAKFAGAILTASEALRRAGLEPVLIAKRRKSALCKRPRASERPAGLAARDTAADAGRRQDLQQHYTDLRR